LRWGESNHPLSPAPEGSIWPVCTDAVSFCRISVQGTKAQKMDFIAAPCNPKITGIYPSEDHLMLNGHVTCSVNDRFRPESDDSAISAALTRPIHPKKRNSSSSICCHEK